MGKEILKFRLEINQEEETDSEELEKLTISLRNQMEEMVESVVIPKEEDIPEGAKLVEPFTWGALIISIVSGGTLVALINFLKDWTLRNKGNTITIKCNGREFQISGYMDLKDMKDIVKELIASTEEVKAD